MANYIVRIDDRSKEVIVGLLKDIQDQLEADILEGKRDENTLLRHEEALRLRRGFLYSTPEIVPPDQEEETKEGELEVDVDL